MSRRTPPARSRGPATRERRERVPHGRWWSRRRLQGPQARPWSRRRLGGEKRQMGSENALPPGCARCVVEQRVEPLHLADEYADVVLAAGPTRGGAEPCAFVGPIEGSHDPVRERARIAPRDDE